MVEWGGVRPEPVRYGQLGVQNGGGRERHRETRDRRGTESYPNQYRAWETADHVGTRGIRGSFDLGRMVDL